MTVTSDGLPGSDHFRFGLVNNPGLEFRVLHQDDMREAATLLATVWQSHDPRGPIEAPILIALGHTGNYIGGAYEDGRLVGVCVGFFSTPLGGTLHSHIAGVLPSHVGRGIGAALKHHQRTWSLDLGIDHITWTFDPLVARNAYFNIRRLRAAPSEYLVDFYGPMPDGLNGGQATDRMLVSWPTRPDTASRDTSARGATTFVALSVGDGLQPVVADLAGVPDDAVCVVGIPRDIEQVRRADARLGHEWREATRSALTRLMSSGLVITDFDDSGNYVLSPVLAEEVR